MAARTRWKDRERVAARFLGTERLPNCGKGAPDAPATLGGQTFAIEHKSRESLPDWLTEAMAQAIRNCPAGAVPLVALTAGAGPGKANHRYVVLRLRDVALLLGTPAPDESLAHPNGQRKG